MAFEQRLAVLAEDAGSTAALDEQAQSLAELRATVVELESRPVGDPELDERLARIETQFAERLAAKPDAGQIEALAARLEAGADEHENLATAVAQLGVRIDEMAWRDDGAATRLEQLQERVEALAVDAHATSGRASRPRRKRARRSGSTSSARASPPCATRSPRSPERSPRRPDRADRPPRRGSDGRARGAAGAGATSRRDREQADGRRRHTGGSRPGARRCPRGSDPRPCPARRPARRRARARARLAARRPGAGPQGRPSRRGPDGDACPARRGARDARAPSTIRWSTSGSRRSQRGSRSSPSASSVAADPRIDQLTHDVEQSARAREGGAHAGHRPGGRERARHAVAEAALPGRPPQRGRGNERRGDAGDRCPPRRAGSTAMPSRWTRPSSRGRSERSWHASTASPRPSPPAPIPPARGGGLAASRRRADRGTGGRTGGGAGRGAHAGHSRSASPPPRRSREPADRSRATRRVSTICSSATG